MTNIPPFDESKYYLGKLCKRLHDWHGTGRSLRLLTGRDCVECKRIYRPRGRTRTRTRYEDRSVTPRDIDRFWRKVPHHLPDEECWEWQGNISPRGYGRMFWPGQKYCYLAHRISWEIAHGEPPSPDLNVCHTCDNPACVNPRHLFLGTQRDNMQDASRKGRIRTGPHEPLIAPDMAKEICRRTEAGESGRAIAAALGVHSSSVYRVRDREGCFPPPTEPRTYVAQHPRSTHCRNGHEYTPDNVYVNSKGYRECRVCRAAGRRRR